MKNVIDPTTITLDVTGQHSHATNAYAFAEALTAAEVFGAEVSGLATIADDRVVTTAESDPATERVDTTAESVAFLQVDGQGYILTITDPYAHQAADYRTALHTLRLRKAEAWEFEAFRPLVAA